MKDTFDVIMVVALLSRGTVEANGPKVTEYALTHVLLQHDWEVAQTYQASGTPIAVLVRRDGTILLSNGNF